MNKRLFFIILFTVLLFSFPIAFAEEAEIGPQPTFILPSSLQEIEEEAFSETAVETVIMPEGLLYIGKNAFSNTLHLTTVYIPKSTEYIDDTAFYTTSNLTIHGLEDSYAKDWAEKHRIPFVVDNIWSTLIQNGRSLNTQGIPIDRLIASINPKKIITVHERGVDEGNSKRPQERPELNPIDYRFP